jgi:hypothetical protein
MSHQCLARQAFLKREGEETLFTEGENPNQIKMNVKSDSEGKK